MRKVSGIEFNLVRSLMLVSIWWNGAWMYRSATRSLRATRRMLSLFSAASQGAIIEKAYFVKGRYYWDMWNPSWPSKAFRQYYNTQLMEYDPIDKDQAVLRRILVAITKKCPLQCEHCSEWDSLNQKDQLTLQQYEDYLDSFVDGGVAQVVYSGGEPLNRYSDLLSLIGRYSDRCDQWVYTSGYQLTEAKAKELASEGLNGVAISLDHHTAEAHNLFRGNVKSYDWVVRSIKNCMKAGLLVAINSCVTREYLSKGGISELIQWARDHGVPMINFIEPRAVGHYAGRDVEYNLDEKMHVESEVVRCSKAREQPIVLYPAMFRSGMPCGGGRSYLFIDYDGSLRPCPFCKGPIAKHEESPVMCKADSLLN